MFHKQKIVVGDLLPGGGVFSQTKIVVGVCFLKQK